MQYIITGYDEFVYAICFTQGTINRLSRCPETLCCVFYAEYSELYLFVGTTHGVVLQKRPLNRIVKRSFHIKMR